ncbi:Prenylcysteine oxidase [Myriangium duriaei CBS 260.36]|uniref:Prenylcysteine oxidase n=1 Tax=Myriangium duriaei CBS 260.36 TaxID=1168546 RepID=A0A9P4IU89_9PEZI|nr:Prenylcysteine oxidase [Myriangium duriaei CBS 260.36]
MRLVYSALVVLSASLLPVTSAQHGPTQQQQPLFDHQTHQQNAPQAIKQVAIIGAGAAGSSTAYHLRRFATEANIPVNITIYDSNPYIGGRSTTIHPFDSPLQPPLELGGSIFVQVNHILVNASRDFNLSTDSMIAPLSSDDRTPDLGVFDGTRLVLVQQSDSYWDLAKLVWRYGLAPWRTLRLMRQTVGRFLTMYTAPVFPFADLTAAVAEIGLADTVAVTGDVFLRLNGVAEGFAHDVVQASTRVNYAQDLGVIHGLETMVCMATEGAMSVDGGNWRIFEGMVRASRAVEVLGTKVRGVWKEKGGRLELQAERSGEMLAVEAYDEVVVAAPMQYTGIKWDGGAPHQNEQVLEHVPDEIPYVELHVTLFTSPHRLAPTAFGLRPDEVVPRAVLTTTPPEGASEAEFLSISLLRDVINPKTGGPEFAYKIFTRKEVDVGFLRRVLGAEGEGKDMDVKDVSWIHKKVWNSYPFELPRVTFEPTKLAKHVWYTAGIESFISTMETSSLMGMNVARLMVDEWGIEELIQHRKRPAIME